MLKQGVQSEIRHYHLGHGLAASVRTVYRSIWTFSTIDFAGSGKEGKVLSVVYIEPDRRSYYARSASQSLPVGAEAVGRLLL